MLNNAEQKNTYKLDMLSYLWQYNSRLNERRYDKTTNKERKATDFTAIVKIVRGGENRYKVGIFRNYRYEAGTSLIV